MSDTIQSGGEIKLVRSLTEVPLDEKLFKADLEVTDRYQNFSAELLRISLLGIGVFGFLIKEVVLNKDLNGHYLNPFIVAKTWFLLGIVALACSAASALAHRFVSSDCIAYQIRYLRLKMARDEALKDKKDGDEIGKKRNLEMKEEKDRLAVRLKWGGHALLIAAVALALGITLIAAGFSFTIFSTTTSASMPVSTNPVSTSGTNSQR